MSAYAARAIPSTGTLPATGTFLCMRVVQPRALVRVKLLCAVIGLNQGPRSWVPAMSEPDSAIISWQPDVECLLSHVVTDVLGASGVPPPPIALSGVHVPCTPAIRVCIITTYEFEIAVPIPFPLVLRHRRRCDHGVHILSGVRSKFSPLPPANRCNN